MLEFLKQQSEESFDSVIQLHGRSRKVLRCLLSWVRQSCEILMFLSLIDLSTDESTLFRALICLNGAC